MNSIRHEAKEGMGMLYLDYAAATPLDLRVREAMEPYLAELFYNPSALYLPARRVRQAVDSARKDVARILGVRSGEVYFTAGATESINIAFGGILRMHPGATIAISALEHSAVVASAHGYASHVVTIPVTDKGRVTPQALRESVTDETVLVSVAYVNGEIGTIQPLAELAKVVAEIRNTRKESGNALPLYFHTDASQAPEYLSVAVQKLGVDMMTLNGGKIYGPKQSGALYIRHGLMLEPVIYGGGQERGLRGGTENVAAAIGFAKALELAQANFRQEAREKKLLQQALMNELEALGGVINGDRKHRVSGNVHVSFRGVNGEMLIHYLDAREIMVATGAACNATGSLASPALMALGLDEPAINGSLRISMGRSTTEADVTRFMTALREVLPLLSPK